MVQKMPILSQIDKTIIYFTFYLTKLLFVFTIYLSLSMPINTLAVGLGGLK